MLILVALAGVVVAIMPNILGQAHSSTSASSQAELMNLVQTHQSFYGKFPDRLDSLVDANDALITYFPFDNTGGDLTVVDVAADPNSAEIIDAFERVGIENLMVHAVTPSNATFENYDALPNVTLAAGHLVEVTDPTIVSDVDLVNNFTATSRFFLLGVGTANTAIGKSMAESPVHLPHEGSVTTSYSRYLLLFAVDPSVDEGPAQLVSVLSAHDDSLPGIGSHLSEYHDSRQ